MTPALFLLAAALAADPARFEFVDAFGPQAGAAPHYRALTLGQSPPRPLAGAPAAAPGTHFALARVGDGPASALGVVWQPDAPGGPALWLDADGDGRLAATERHPFPGKTLELPARVRVGREAFTRTLIFRRGTGPNLYVAVRGFMRGRLTVGGKEYSAALTDGDADGCFDTAGADRVWIDLDGDGAFDPLTEQFALGTPVAVGGQFVLVQPDPTGAAVRVRARGSETGRLTATVPMRPGSALREIEASLVSEFGELAMLRAAGTAAELPAGRYRVESLTVRAADARGRVWRFQFSGLREFALEVKTGRETTADLLEGLALTTGVAAATAAPGSTVLVAPMWQTPSGLYLVECDVDGGQTSADILLADSGGTPLDLAVSGFA
jgi:hypothetical protein